MTDVSSIVKEWLVSHKYDGLFNDAGECGCSVDDLMPCYCNNTCDCVPAYRYVIDDEDYYSPEKRS